MTRYRYRRLADSWQITGHSPSGLLALFGGWPGFL